MNAERRRASHLPLALVVFVLALTALTACGNKGPLVPPPPKATVG